MASSCHAQRPCRLNRNSDSKRGLKSEHFPIFGLAEAKRRPRINGVEDGGRSRRVKELKRRRQYARSKRWDEGRSPLRGRARGRAAAPPLIRAAEGLRRRALTHAAEGPVAQESRIGRALL